MSGVRMVWNEQYFRSVLMGGAVRELLDSKRVQVEGALRSAGVDDAYTDWYRGARRNAIDVRGAELWRESQSGVTARVYGGL